METVLATAPDLCEGADKRAMEERQTGRRNKSQKLKLSRRQQQAMAGARRRPQWIDSNRPTSLPRSETRGQRDNPQCI